MLQKLCIFVLFSAETQKKFFLGEIPNEKPVKLVSCISGMPGLPWDGAGC